jgi:hypothetical protein
MRQDEDDSASHARIARSFHVNLSDDPAIARLGAPLASAPRPYFRTSFIKAPSIPLFRVGIVV